MQNKGGTERAGGIVLREGVRNKRRDTALKKQTNKHIYEHLKAQERGHRKKVGVQTKSESSDEKRASTRTASERKTSETKTNERENEHTKSEGEQNENERA